MRVVGHRLLKPKQFSTSAKVDNAFWLPFNDNRSFKNVPRLVDRADGMYYYQQGTNKKILDGTSGLW